MEKETLQCGDRIMAILNDDVTARAAGLKIATLLQLSPSYSDGVDHWSDPRFKTIWGTETAVELARSLISLIFTDE